MIELKKFSEFNDEHISWLKKLELLELESVSLKYRIAEIVRKEINPLTLLEVEYFHDLLLRKDEFISSLRGDIKQQNFSLSDHCILESIILSNWVNKKQGKLRQEVNKAQKDLIKFKLKFNNFFTKIYLPVN